MNSYLLLEIDDLLITPQPTNNDIDNFHFHNSYLEILAQSGHSATTQLNDLILINPREWSQIFKEWIKNSQNRIIFYSKNLENHIKYKYKEHPESEEYQVSEEYEEYTTYEEYPESKNLLIFKENYYSFLLKHFFITEEEKELLQSNTYIHDDSSFPFDLSNISHYQSYKYNITHIIAHNNNQDKSSKMNFFLERLNQSFDAEINKKIIALTVEWNPKTNRPIDLSILETYKLALEALENISIFRTGLPHTFQTMISNTADFLKLNHLIKRDNAFRQKISGMKKNYNLLYDIKEQQKLFFYLEHYDIFSLSHPMVKNIKSESKEFTEMNQKDQDFFMQISTLKNEYKELVCLKIVKDLIIELQGDCLTPHSVYYNQFKINKKGYFDGGSTVQINYVNQITLPDGIAKIYGSLFNEDGNPTELLKNFKTIKDFHLYAYSILTSNKKYQDKEEQSYLKRFIKPIRNLNLQNYYERFKPQPIQLTQKPQNPNLILKKYNSNTNSHSKKSICTLSTQASSNSLERKCSNRTNSHKALQSILTTNNNTNMFNNV